MGESAKCQAHNDCMFLETNSRDKIEALMGKAVDLYRRSRFTFVIEGDSSTSARTFSAIAMLSIPVISNYQRLPYADLLDWGEFAVLNFSPGEPYKQGRTFPQLLQHLRNIPTRNVTRMQHKLAEVRPLFLYSYDKPREDGRDVFGMVLRGLAHSSRVRYRRSCRMRAISQLTQEERDALNPLYIYEECLLDGTNKPKEECHALAYD
jgi:hypothetical protein